MSSTRASPRALVRARGLRYSYGAAAPVLVEVDLELETGLMLLVGPNGCGKSTLVRLLAGVERPQGGSIHVAGHDLWLEEVQARSALVYVPEQPELVPYATVREIVQLVAALRGRGAQDAERALAEAGIATDAERTARQLSQGQRRRVLVAAALLGEPRVVLLDEPLEALDRGACDRLLAWLDARLEGGAAALVISHRIGPFLARAAWAATVRSGRLVVRALAGADDAERRELVERMARGEDGESEESSVGEGI